MTFRVRGFTPNRISIAWASMGMVPFKARDVESLIPGYRLEDFEISGGISGEITLSAEYKLHDVEVAATAQAAAGGADAGTIKDKDDGGAYIHAKEEREVVESPDVYQFTVPRDARVQASLNQSKALRELFGDVAFEVANAMIMHPRAFNTHHEAYAVLLEEAEEYWESVKEDEPDPRELVQIAAVAIRAIFDLEPRFNYWTKADTHFPKGKF